MLNNGPAFLLTIEPCHVSGHLEAFCHISQKLKLDIIGDDFFLKVKSSVSKSQQGNNNLEATGTTRTGKMLKTIMVYEL